MIFFYAVLLAALIFSAIKSSKILFKNTNKISPLLEFNTLAGYSVFTQLLFLLKFVRYFQPLERVSKQLDYLFCVQIWKLSCIFVSKPDTFKFIANKVINRGATFAIAAAEGGGEGLITIQNANLWKEHRRLLAPAFNIQEMASVYLPAVNSVCHTVIEKLESDNKIISWSDTTRWQVKIFSKAMMKYDMVDDEAIVITEGINRTHQDFFWRLLIPLRNINFINNWWKKIARVAEYRTEARNIVEKIIEKRRMVESQTDVIQIAEEQQNCPIDLLIRGENLKIYNRHTVVEEVEALFDAASSTLGTAMNYILLMLALHPNCQERAYQEVICVSRGDGVTTHEQLKELAYLEQCINETLRLFTPAPFVTREPEQDLKLKDGRIIPKGTTIILAIDVLHKNHNIYNRPQIWDPDRFLLQQRTDERKSSENIFAFVAGPRMCPGSNFSYFSLKLQLCAILAKFKITTDMTYSDVINGMYIAVTRRNTNPLSLYFRPRNIN